MKTKFEGRNFFVSILSIAYGVLSLNGIGFNQGDVISSFDAHDYMALVINILNPMFTTIDKISKKEFTWKAYLESTNFKVNVITATTIVLATFMDLKLAGLAGILLFNIWNIYYHYDSKRIG